MTPTPHSFHNQVRGPGPAAVLASGDLGAEGMNGSGLCIWSSG